MSDANTTLDATKYRIPEGSSWSGAWKISAAIGALGSLAALAGAVLQPERFAFSYLYGFITVMTLWLGSVFFVLIQHLTGAGWSASVRRSAEFLISGVVVLPLLFLPLVPNLKTLYPWWSADKSGAAQAQEHAVEHAPTAHEAGHEAGHEAVSTGEENGEEHGPHALIEEATLKKKGAFLNHGFFGLRACVYFLVWLWLGLRLFGYSTAQDASGDKQWTVKLQRMAPVATMLFALSLTFAGFDWVMSLEPGWYSTMFGVRIFASSAVTSFASVILLTLGWKRAGLIHNEVNTEHYHDLGKLMFGFLVFWAYISFSEFMLIWYAAIPEETIYYHRRWDLPSWQVLSVMVVVLKFIVPFYAIISRNAKRNHRALGFAAAWLLGMHLLEMYYWVMPYYRPYLPVQFAGMWMEAGCVMATVGIYLTAVFRTMRKYPLIAVGDPRLSRAIDFVNV